MIRRPRYIYSIVPRRRINRWQTLRISLLVIIGLLYFNKHYYIKNPQNGSLISLFGLDTKEPNYYKPSQSASVTMSDSDSAEAYLFPTNQNNLSAKNTTNSPLTVQNTTDSIKIKGQNTDTIINVKGITSSIPQAYNVQYFKDSTTNVVFTGAFQNRDNAERILKRLKDIGYDKAEIIMKEGVPYSIVVSGFYTYKSSAKAEVRALHRRGIEAYETKKDWSDIYRK